MSEQDNINIVRKVIDALNSHNADATVQYFAPNVKGMVPDRPETLNRDQIREYNQRFIRAVPDLHFDIKDMLAQGDKAVVSWVAHGTQKGALDLPTGGVIPATNKLIHEPGVTIVEFHDGMITRQDVYWDQVTFLTQIGLLTPETFMQMLQR